jgi:hypothetical protein
MIAGIRQSSRRASRAGFFLIGKMGKEWTNCPRSLLTACGRRPVGFPCGVKIGAGAGQRCDSAGDWTRAVLAALV